MVKNNLIGILLATTIFLTGCKEKRRYEANIDGEKIIYNVSGDEIGERKSTSFGIGRPPNAGYTLEVTKTNGTKLYFEGRYNFEGPFIDEFTMIDSEGTRTKYNAHGDSIQKDFINLAQEKARTYISNIKKNVTETETAKLK